MIKLILIFMLTIPFLNIMAADPLDEIDGTESWYEGSMDGDGDIVYYNASYEKDMKIYLAYLKSKQQNKNQIKSISSKVNRRKSSEVDDKSDEMGELGSIKEDDDLGNSIDKDGNSEEKIKNDKKDKDDKKVKEKTEEEKEDEILDEDLD